jgi:hypothetical protein
VEGGKVGYTLFRAFLWVKDITFPSTPHIRERDECLENRVVGDLGGKSILWCLFSWALREWRNDDNFWVKEKIGESERTTLDEMRRKKQFLADMNYFLCR